MTERKRGFYEKYVKRFLDIFFSLLAIAVFSWLFIDILKAPGRFSALYVSLQYIFPDIYSGILAGADKLQLHSDGRNDYARHNNSASIRGIIQ